MRPTRRRWLLLYLAVIGCSQGRSGAPYTVREVDASELHAVTREAHSFSVRDMALGPESLWILDGAAPFVTRVSLANGRVTRFGEEGHGPGEFLNPRAIQPDTGDGALGVSVWDLANRWIGKSEVPPIWWTPHN